MSRRHLLAALLLGAMATSLVSCNSASTTSATSPIDLSPPQPPTNLHSTSDAATSREWLHWDPSASASVAGYEIYSSATPTGATTMVSTLDPSTTDYALPIVGANTTDFYRVRAVGTNNVPSAFTAALSVDRVTWEGATPTSGRGRGTKGEF